VSAVVVYDVSGMTCGHCVAAVTKELRTLPGVTEVEVRLDDASATVVGAVDDADVVAAIAEAGYEAVRRR
jgi:copper chaperone CopZ